MKTTLILFCSFLFITNIAFTQEFRQQTNQFQLNTDKLGKAGDQDIPVIIWVTPERIQTTSLDNKINIKIRVNSKTKIENIKIVILDTKRGDELAAKEIIVESNGQNYRDLEYTLNLPEGYSKIEIQALNGSGGISTSTREIITGKKAVSESAALLRHDHALLFATDKYEYWPSLVNPVYDAETIAKELQDNYGFEIEIVRNPTTEQIMVKLREYAEKEYGKLDQLMIFIAGHGQYDEAFGMGYVVGKNSLRNDRSKTSYISHSNLRDIINNIPCEHIFLAMDVCFGGTFDQKLSGERGVYDMYDEISKSDFIMRKLQYKTRRYITSGGKEYVSDGIPGNHSPFVRKFLDALRSYGGQDRVLTLQELYVYVEKMDPQPRTGEFGDNKPGSDFVFVAK